MVKKNRTLVELLRRRHAIVLATNSLREGESLYSQAADEIERLEHALAAVRSAMERPDLGLEDRDYYDQRAKAIDDRRQNILDDRRALDPEDVKL